MIRAFFGVSLAVLALAAACGGGSSPKVDSSSTPRAGVAADAAACGPARTHAPGDFDQSMTGGVAPRSYVLHIPTGYDGLTPIPLVLAFHGFGFSARQMMEYTKFPALADQQGAVVVSLDGTGTPSHWNWRKAAADADDVKFVSDLLIKLREELCLDADRVFAAGFSDGAALSRVLACELPDVFAAVAVVATPNVACVAPVPMIAFHGTADPLVPFEGGTVPPEVGGGGTFPPVRRSVSEWARALGCDGLPLISRPAASVELSTFVHCKLGDGDALLYTLIGGGHTWPRSAPLLVDQFGATSDGIDATATIWEFFAAHPRGH